MSNQRVAHIQHPANKVIMTVAKDQLQRWLDAGWVNVKTKTESESK